MLIIIWWAFLFLTVFYPILLDIYSHLLLFIP